MKSGEMLVYCSNFWVTAGKVILWIIGIYALILVSLTFVLLILKQVKRDLGCDLFSEKPLFPSKSKLLKFEAGNQKLTLQLRQETADPMLSSERTMLKMLHRLKINHLQFSDNCFPFPFKADIGEGLKLCKWVELKPHLQKLVDLLGDKPFSVEEIPLNIDQPTQLVMPYP